MKNLALFLTLILLMKIPAISHPHQSIYESFGPLEVRPLKAKQGHPKSVNA